MKQIVAEYEKDVFKVIPVENSIELDTFLKKWNLFAGVEFNDDLQVRSPRTFHHEHLISLNFSLLLEIQRNSPIFRVQVEISCYRSIS